MSDATRKQDIRKGRAVPDQPVRKGTPAQRPAKAGLFCALAALGFVGLSGCGYKAGGPFRTDVNTIYVDMFESREFRRDLEFMLTEAVKKRIGMSTPYRLADKSKADTILTGAVLEERQAALAPDFRSRQPLEKQMTMVVKVQWKDLRTGKILMDQPLALQSVDYLFAAGETEKFAQQRAMDRLAERIVGKMYDEW